MTSASVNLTARIERWPIAGRFAISRGAKTEAAVIVAELSRGGHVGRGECVPYARYGETPEATLAAILAMGETLAAGLDRAGLQQAMPPGAARNALDCALWDLEAKAGGRRVWEMLGMATPRPLTTAYTLSLGSADAMARRPRAPRTARSSRSSSAAAATRPASRRSAARRRMPS